MVSEIVAMDLLVKITDTLILVYLTLAFVIGALLGLAVIALMFIIALPVFLYESF